MKKEIHSLDIPYNQFFVPHNVLEEDRFIKMTSSAKVLYMYLCKLKNRMPNKINFYRSIQSLSRDTGMCIKTIKKAKKELIKNMYIDVIRDTFLHTGFRSADRFVLNGYKSKDQKTPKG